ncbi:TIGR03792 family protein [Leptolyngbya sp. AN02str]|uniref:TIGR03792 family protein n=1 Tax=Leptolyngbya sp. AN02str TaxID=3423363 RepID=UPI003D31370B
MEIECLRVRVDPELREAYIRKDAEIWTETLAQYPGFLGKEVWISPDDLSEVVLTVRWASFEEWQAIPDDVLQATEARFDAAVGGNYELVESSRYQIRKFGDV